MRLIYIDDSGDEQTSVYSAICVKDDRWRDCFKMLREHRSDLRKRYGLFVRRELHATELVAGRGHISDRVVTKHQRSIIFDETIQLIARMPDVRILNACGPRNAKTLLFERLVNRINRTLESWGERAILFIDEGGEVELTRMLRRMSVYNPVPSNQGVWQDTGNAVRNIPVERIIEDPVFKNSADSFFVQCADVVAFSLLRKERPLPSRNRYGIHLCFDKLDNVLVKVAFRSDPNHQGIIRA